MKRSDEKRQRGVLTNFNEKRIPIRQALAVHAFDRLLKAMQFEAWCLSRLGMEEDALDLRDVIRRLAAIREAAYERAMDNEKRGGASAVDGGASGSGVSSGEGLGLPPERSGADEEPLEA